MLEKLPFSLTISHFYFASGWFLGYNAGMRSFACVLAVLAAAAAQGSLIATGPFEGDHFEGFGGFENGFYQRIDAMDGFAHFNPFGEFVEPFSIWDFPIGFLGSDLAPAQNYDGKFLVIGHGFGAVHFDTKIARFGAYIYSDWGRPVQVQVLRDSGVLLDNFEFTPTPGQWNWFGFESTEYGIHAIGFMNVGGANGVAYDDMRVDLVPEPGTWAALGLGLAAVRRRKAK